VTKSLSAGSDSVARRSMAAGLPILDGCGDLSIAAVRYSFPDGVESAVGTEPPLSRVSDQPIDDKVRPNVNKLLGCEPTITGVIADLAGSLVRPFWDFTASWMFDAFGHVAPRPATRNPNERAGCVAKAHK
jgi:hypothetical protein